MASGGKRSLDVVALVPPAASAAAGEVPILLHLHGVSVFEEHNYEEMLGQGKIPGEFEIPQQLQAAGGKSGSRMIAVLPIGKTYDASKEGDKEKTYGVSFGALDADTLADATIARLVSEGKLPEKSSAGGVVLSAHSGGGGNARGAASGKKVVGMFAFESVHDYDAARYRTMLEGKLDHDLAELQTRAAPAGADSAADDKAFQAQKQYLLDKGFRFVGFAGSNPSYRKRFRALRGAVHGDGGWFENHAADFSKASGSHSAELREMLEANYQFNIEDKGDHFQVVAQGHLQQALGTLPASMRGGG